MSRRKDAAAALMGVANAVQHGGMSLDAMRERLKAIAQAGFADPGPDRGAAAQAREAEEARQMVESVEESDED